MKSVNLTSCIFILVFLLVISSAVFPQEKQDSSSSKTPNITLNYLNTSNDTIILSASVSIKRELGVFALQNAEITFEASAGGNESKFLGKVKTDVEGNAVIKVVSKIGIPTDKERKTIFTAKFPGGARYLACFEKTSVRLAKILVSFAQEDTVRVIKISAFQVENGVPGKPLTKEKVTVYVPRLFTLLKIGETTLDENGKGQVEYPEKLVGDSLGNITIYAKIEENDIYGNVQGKSSITWGIPKQYFLAERPARQLWTPVAPIWMIVTLIIMLTGVWAHYLYAVFQLIMIKRHAQKLRNNPPL
ncbi:MAG: hypothetical protein NTX61_06055 [Bacteroidetes bacterium]|nr:hypothetical protein [Bacteroidota bacterium]